MSNTFKNSAKKKELEKLLVKGVAYIYINPTIKGVLLPVDLMSQPSTTLQVSYEFEGSLFVKDEFIETSLFFGATYETCLVPYDALWAIGTPKEQFSKVWHEDMPQSVASFFYQVAKEGQVVKEAIEGVTQTEKESGDVMAKLAENPKTALVKSAKIKTKKTSARSSTSNLDSVDDNSNNVINLSDNPFAKNTTKRSRVEYKDDPENAVISLDEVRKKK